MSSIATLNGVQYIIPAYNDTGWAQGTGNLSQYLAAIASATLQPTGGSFTLTADVDFGSSFGLKALFLKTETANPASAGVIRLASTDTIKWRNNANGADIALSKDTSDLLNFGGSPVVVGLNPTLQSLSLSSATNQIQLNSTGNRTIISGGTQATDRTYSFPDGGANRTILLAGWAQIVNADINASAAIAYSKLALSASIVNADIASAAAIAVNKLAALTVSRAVATDGSGFLTVATTTAAELAFVSGVTSAIQTQLNAKAPLASPTFTGTVVVPNASGSTSPVAFGQMYQGFQAPVQVTSASSTTNTTTTYATAMSASITPTSSSHRIKISVSGSILTSDSTMAAYVTIARGSTNLAGANGFTFFNIPSGANITAPVAINYIDSPATTSSTTYNVQIKTDVGGKAAIFNQVQTAVIILEEIV